MQLESDSIVNTSYEQRSFSLDPEYSFQDYQNLILQV